VRGRGGGFAETGAAGGLLRPAPPPQRRVWAVSWAEKFSENHLVKGEKAAYQPVLFSQADKQLLQQAAKAAGVSGGVLAARIVVAVLKQNRHRFDPAFPPPGSSDLGS
jgi:hypothetical protein